MNATKPTFLKTSVYVSPSNQQVKVLINDKWLEFESTQDYSQMSYIELRECYEVLKRRLLLVGNMIKRNLKN